MYGNRARIGYCSPLVINEVFAYEFYSIVPKGVTLMVSTLTIKTRSKSEIEESHAASLTVAKSMAESGASVVVLGGNPINLSRGVENLDGLTRDLEQKIGTAVTTSTVSQIKALKLLGAKKVATVHPWKEDHNHRHEDSIRKFGFDPAGVRGAGYEIPQAGQIPEETALELARQIKNDNPEADCIHFACAHWGVAHIIQQVEDELDVCVMTSQQAILWQALRRAGVNDKVKGYGRLFAEF
jgi:maleate isomerase